MLDFATQSAYPLISFDQAWALVAAHMPRLMAAPLDLADLLGLVLAEDVLSTEEAPPFAAATMDGYAVVASDVSPSRAVIAEQDAGHISGLAVAPGTAMRIMTGAPLPAGADAVIPVEDTFESTEQGRQVHLQREVRPGENVRPIGSDLHLGQAVLAQGTVIGPAEIGLLATIGRTRVLAYPRPRVAILVTGDELVSPGETPGPGQIRDSNSYALAAAVQLAGGSALIRHHLADSLAGLRLALEQAAESADVVITSGGVSMGTHDLVKPALEQLGQVHFGRVAIKPGKPLTFATLDGCAFFGLPGNPVSSLVCFENTVRPAMRLMSGHKRLWRPEKTVRLLHPVRHDADRTEFQRATIVSQNGEDYATTTGAQASSRLLSMVGANALLRIPQGVGNLDQSERVSAILIDQPEVE